MWRVQKLFFRIKKVREITLDFSKAKAEIRGMCAEIVLGTNRRKFLKLGDGLVKICD